MLSTKVQIIILFVTAVVAATCGRWLSPTKVITQVKTVTQVVEAKDTKKHETTVKTEKDLPDGTKEIVTKTEENDDTKDNVVDNTTTQSTKTVERSGSRTTIAVLGATNISSLTNLSYGLSITRDVLGPISVGAFGLSNGTGGVSIGVSF